MDRKFDAYRQRIRSIVLVGSGKGGVGKSSVAAALALRLRARHFAVGVLDADLQGPSMPVLLRAAGPLVVRHNLVVPANVAGIKLMSTGLLASEDKAFPWVGPFVVGVLRQFVRDVDWGELDFLIVDLPPGTGEVHKALLDLVTVDGIVVVTTPHATSEADVRRALAMYDALSVPVLALVENMATTHCPCCGSTHRPFSGNAGEVLATDFGIGLLTRLPVETNAVDSCRSSVATSKFVERVDDLAREVVQSSAAGDELRTRRPTLGPATAFARSAPSLPKLLIDP